MAKSHGLLKSKMIHSKKRVRRKTRQMKQGKIK